MIIEKAKHLIPILFLVFSFKEQVVDCVIEFSHFNAEEYVFEMELLDIHTRLIALNNCFKIMQEFPINFGQSSEEQDCIILLQQFIVTYISKNVAKLSVILSNFLAMKYAIAFAEGHLHFKTKYGEQDEKSKYCAELAVYLANAPKDDFGFEAVYPDSRESAAATADLIPESLNNIWNMWVDMAGIVRQQIVENYDSEIQTINIDKMNLTNLGIYGQIEVYLSSLIYGRYLAAEGYDEKKSKQDLWNMSKIIYNFRENNEEGSNTFPDPDVTMVKVLREIEYRKMNSVKQNRGADALKFGFGDNTRLELFIASGRIGRDNYSRDDDHKGSLRLLAIKNGKLESGSQCFEIVY